jgi:hypothetical protein
MKGRRRPLGRLVIALGGAAIAAGAAHAQGATGTVRLAFLPQIVVGQQAGGRDFRTVLDGGVVDGPVFVWQRGLIERRSLVLKPIRLVTGDEAAGLGGRGQFQVVGVRASRGPSAWVDVDVADAGGGPDDRLILEVGGEQYPVRQILSTLFVAPPGEGLTALPLSPQAFRPGPGVPVIETRLGFPVKAPGAPAAFRGLKGVEFLVARSPIRVGANQDVTTNGPADRAEGPLEGGADWRDGDRVYVRISAAALREGTLAIAMGWKDRTYKSDPDPGGHNTDNFPIGGRRSVK